MQSGQLIIHTQIDCDGVGLVCEYLVIDMEGYGVKQRCVGLPYGLKASFMKERCQKQ